MDRYSVPAWIIQIEPSFRTFPKQQTIMIFRSALFLVLVATIATVMSSPTKQVIVARLIFLSTLINCLFHFFAVSNFVHHWHPMLWAWRMLPQRLRNSEKIF